MRCVVPALITIAAALGEPFTTSTAHADSLAVPASADARTHLKLGNKLYRIRSFEQAIVEYKAGALIEAAPVFDYNLGQCFRQLDKYKEAIWHYERFLTYGHPRGEVLDAVTSFLVDMKAGLDRQAKAGVAKEAAARTPSAPQQGLDSAPLALQSEQPRPVQRAAAWYHDGFGWALTATGFAGLAVGGGFLISGANLNNEANTSPSDGERVRLHDKADSRDLLGGVIAISGAAVLTAGIVKLAIHPAGPSHVARWNVAASGNGVMVFGQF